MTIEQLSWDIHDLKRQAEDWKYEFKRPWRDEEYRRDALQIFYRLQDQIIDRQRKLADQLRKKERLAKYA